MADNDELTGIPIAGIPIQWSHAQGTCTFNAQPTIMKRIDSTLAGLMAELQALVGTERFYLILQSEGQKSAAEDWQVISAHKNFSEGFQALAVIAATAGWGDWQLISTDYEKKECVFRIKNGWEGGYQRALGGNWGCGMLAGKLAGYTSRLFDTNCRAEQISFSAQGEDADTFIVKPSHRTIESERENLLAMGAATGPDTSQTLKKLREEIEARTIAEQQLRLSRMQLEERVFEQTAKYRESEKKYRKLVEDTHDLIAHLTPRGRLTFINRAAQKILDLSPVEYLGLSLFRFIHPEDRRRVLTWWRGCLADQSSGTFIELRQVNVKNGQAYNLQWSAAIQYSAAGKISGIGVIGRDVSEMRKAEQEYRNLFSKMFDGFALHKIICRGGRPADYRFLSVNPAFEKITGLAAKDLLGKTALEVLPNLEQHWIDAYGKVALSGEPSNFEQYTAELDKHFQIAAYCPAPGQFACIFQDITLRKKAEQEKANLETQLRQRHKMEAIGTLAGGIAHDFNNILAAILGYADMALEEIPLWHSAHNQIQEVVKAGNRAKDLVRQILTFSRKEEQHREPVNLYALITEVVVFLRATIPTTIDILLDLDPDCGNLLGNQTQIHQVLMNICTNAAQAMETHGGTLAIILRQFDFSEQTQSPIAGLKQGHFLRLDIRDTEPAFRKNISSESSIRISPPRNLARARAWGSPSSTALSKATMELL